VPFRVYYLDRRARVAGALDIEARSLEEARREARARNPGHPGLELWRVDEAMRWMRLVESTSSSPHA